MDDRSDLPPECEEYLREYARIALDPSGIPPAERERILAQARAGFEQSCSTPEGRAMMIQNCPQWTASMHAAGAAAIRPAQPTTPSTAPGRRIVGDPNALTPADRAFVDFWRSARGDCMRYLFTDDVRTEPVGQAPSEQVIKGLKLIAIPGYSETYDPQSTGAKQVRFWKTTDGRYVAQETGGCIALRNDMFGPFGQRGDTFAPHPPRDPLVEGIGYRGVIFAAERAPFSFLFGATTRYWTPDEQDVARAEQLVATHLRTAAPQLLGRLESRSYLRQYAGLEQHERRVVFINFFCDGSTSWRWKEVFVFDGGDYYFNVKCDLVARRCFDLRVNGEA